MFICTLLAGLSQSEGKNPVILILIFFCGHMTSVSVSSEVKPEPLDDDTEEILPS